MNQDAVKSALHDCIEHARGDGITLGTMLATLGQAGFCFAALLLAVPFVQPFSLGPLTMIGGITFAALGWQMGRGRSCPDLPKAANELRIHGPGWVRVLEFCARLLSFCRRFTRVRQENWVSGPWGERFVGWLIFAGGLLLAMPMASLPFNNSLPALMIVFACIGWLERDGLMTLVSLGWGVATILYFVAVGVAFFIFGSKIFVWISNWWPF
ncbi:MAG: exopolysaccharide biosynthesis protein [Blastochloris sp.]|nr:exopolysaccharide biosynthesis protein [Blastochloris sp.]